MWRLFSLKFPLAFADARKTQKISFIFKFLVFETEKYINTLLNCIETPLTENRAYEDNAVKFQECRNRDHIILYKRHVVQFR